MSKQSPMITDQDWMQALKEMRDQINQRDSELAAARETIKTLNRRAQQAEAGVRDNIEACKRAGVSMGRTLANAAADMYLRRAEKAESERDAQHEQVLRLTAERDEARRVQGVLSEDLGFVANKNETHIRQGRALQCSIDELTATRDLLTDENARLQKEVATLRYLHNGGH